MSTGVRHAYVGVARGPLFCHIIFLFCDFSGLTCPFYQLKCIMGIN